MKRHFFIIILSLSVLTCGCATFDMLVDEAKQIKTEEARPQIESVGTLVDGMIPNPYKIPVAVGLGYIFVLARRVYKRKKGSKG